MLDARNTYCIQFSSKNASRKRLVSPRNLKWCIRQGRSSAKGGKKNIVTANYYWEHEQTRRLEFGIGIYDPSYWNSGLGTEALTLWITHLFGIFEVERIGLATWSGNVRMMRCAEKLGMKLEGMMRRCRYYQGHYYDVIRYGVLREEWQIK